MSAKRRDPFGGNVAKSNHLPQRAVYNDTLNRLFATPTPSARASSSSASSAMQTPSIVPQHTALYDAQCYVCMSQRPALECVSCARSTCQPCARQCARCQLLACALCSQVSYAARFEQTFCFDCFRVEQQITRQQQLQLQQQQQHEEQRHQLQSFHV